MKKFNWKLFVVSLLIPIIVGGLSALLTMGSMNIYSEINVPFFAPPGWLFAPVWTILYVLMGVSLYLILSSGGEKKEGIYYFSLQLIFNFFWSIIFFNFRLYWLAFVWLLVMIYLIVRTLIKFFEINKVSAYLLLPYLVWSVFAAVLNLAIAILN